MEMVNKLEQLKIEISKNVIGRNLEVEMMVIALLNNGHILMESVPGTGKTVLAKALAEREIQSRAERRTSPPMESWGPAR